MNKGIITLELEEIDPNTLALIRGNIHAMIEQGAFSIKNGRVVLHFDHTGTLQIIAVDYIKWKREKASASSSTVLR